MKNNDSKLKYKIYLKDNMKIINYIIYYSNYQIYNLIMNLINQYKIKFKLKNKWGYKLNDYFIFIINLIFLSKNNSLNNFIILIMNYYIKYYE